MPGLERSGQPDQNDQFPVGAGGVSALDLPTFGAVAAILAAAALAASLIPARRATRVDTMVTLREE